MTLFRHLFSTFFFFLKRSHRCCTVQELVPGPNGVSLTSNTSPHISPGTHWPPLRTCFPHKAINQSAATAWHLPTVFIATKKTHFLTFKTHFGIVIGLRSMPSDANERGWIEGVTVTSFTLTPFTMCCCNYNFFSSVYLFIESPETEAAMEVGATEVVESEVFYDCVICGQSGPSTEDRPIGLVVLLQASSGNSISPHHDTPFISHLFFFFFWRCLVDWQCWDTAAKVKKRRSSRQLTKNISMLLTRVESPMTSDWPSCRGSLMMYVFKKKPNSIDTIKWILTKWFKSCCFRVPQYLVLSCSLISSCMSVSAFSWHQET